MGSVNLRGQAYTFIVFAQHFLEKKAFFVTLVILLSALKQYTKSTKVYACPHSHFVLYDTTTIVVVSYHLL
jgi:hypothetical protein